MKAKKKVGSAAEKMEIHIHRAVQEKYLLRLYVTGSTVRSVSAIANLKNICEEYLEGQYELEIIDLYENPSLAKGDQIIAAPTLIKKLPLPFRHIIGDMSDKEKVLLGLDLREIRKK